MKLLKQSILLVLTLLIGATTLEASQSSKKYFRTLVVPAIDEVFNELQEQYNEISANINNRDYAQKISNLKKIYKVSVDEDLLMAIKPHPRSIAIAQAAMESAWAKSRFFKQANNLYGIWSLNKNEPRIAALQKRGNKRVWLKKYSTIKESIHDYYKTIGRSHAFKEFRKLKMLTDNPYELVKKLDNYSEIGPKYSEGVNSIIRYNKFYLYDK